MEYFSSPGCGRIFDLALIENQDYGLVAPASLIFYGLALVNGSKYTMGEVRWLGYGEIILGIINLWIPGKGIFFWTLGFGCFTLYMVLPCGGNMTESSCSRRKSCEVLKPNKV